MEKDTSCAYCMEGELVAKFGIKICEMDTCKVYLFKEQKNGKQQRYNLCSGWMEAN